MYNKLLAVMAAAVGAAVMVSFIPPPQPASAAKAPQANVVAIEKPRVDAVDTEKQTPVLAPPATCTQGWPHYEQNCLRDSRRPNGTARVARVVAMDRSVADRSVTDRVARVVATDRSVADRPLRARH
jgi:hypothetical protein